MKTISTADYWNQRYQQGNTPWDMGQVSPPLKHYLDNHVNKDTRILIPGAGRAYEAAYLHQSGYENVYVCDWAASSFDQLRERVPDFPEEHLLISDFFQLDLQVDLILEQTFFCAIDPSLRLPYVQKAANLLPAGAKLAGLFWNHAFLDGPPFGGSLSEYRALFSPYFNILQDDLSPYSIGPRKGRELFLELERK